MTSRDRGKEAKRLAEEKKEQERLTIEKKKQEEEALAQQEANDLQDFTQMPRVTLNIKSAFGINDNLKINDVKMGTTFSFLQTPGSRMQGQPSEDVQLLYSAGRQLAIKNTINNKVQMVPNSNHHSHQITAICALYNSDTSKIAMAEQDYYDPSKLYFSVHEVQEGNNIVAKSERVKIDLQTDDQNDLFGSPAQVGDNSILAGTNGQGGGNNAAVGMSDFQTAALQSPDMRQSITNQQSILPKKKELPFVSQICFSGNFKYIACLISGPINRIVVYEVKGHNIIKPIVMENFPISHYTDEMMQSPSNVDKSRMTEQSRISSHSFYQQSVTQISFFPNHCMSLCLTGPNARLDYCKIKEGHAELDVVHDPKFEEIREIIGEDTITCHAWSSDGTYFGVCTTSNQVVVYKVGSQIVHESQYEMGSTQDRSRGMEAQRDTSNEINILVSIQLFELGMALATSDGTMIFFEINEDGEFIQIRKWKYRSKELQDSFYDDLISGHQVVDVVRGIKVLDTDRQKKLAVQLANRNVILIDIFNEVYFQDKRDDIHMKMQEHEFIINSEDEKNRLIKLSKQDENKALEAQQKEKEEIEAISYKVVGQGNHSGEITEMHTCLQRPILLTMSHEDQTIRLWNYEDNICELEKNFALNLGGQKPLVSCALHPSGYYAAVALNDNIQLFHVLHEELQQFRTYEMKQARRIIFSSGGQYLCVIDHKNVHIFSTYTLQRVRNLQIPPNTISTMAFNFNDSRLVFISEEGLMQSFDLETFQRVGELRNDRSYQYKSAVYVSHDDNENNMLITVGTQKDVCGSLRIFKDDEMTACIKIQGEEQFENQEESLCFTDIVKVVSADNLIENLIIGTNRGSLTVYGIPPRFLREDPKYKYGETVSHYGEVSAIKASIDGKYLFSAGKDGIIFMYEIVEHIPQTRRGFGGSMNNMAGQSSTHQQSRVENTTANLEETKRESMDGGLDSEDSQEQNNVKNPTTTTPMLTKKGIEIQDELARIVLVRKDKMEDWRKNQETLRTDMEKQQDKVDSSLREENFQFVQRNNKMEKVKTKQLNELNAKYEKLQMEEAEQKDENQQQMNKLEINHNQCKEELQDLYEKKLEYEQEQFKKLKENQNEDRKSYEKQIKHLNDLHDEQVEKLLEEFKRRLQDVQQMYEDSKKIADDLKMKNEEKLTSQEQDQLHEITELTNEQSEVIKKHIEQISELSNNIEREKYHKNKINAEIQALDKKTSSIKHRTLALQRQGKEYEKSIKQLDQDRTDASKNLSRKEDELFQQKFKIKDLQKTKQVLTHRTFEMKASLEPKEQQIESLKLNLHDLEKLFGMQQKSLFQMQENVDQKKASQADLEKKLQVAKKLTKKKGSEIQDFVQDIQKTMQKEDDSDKLQGFMTIYRKHVKIQSEEIQTKKQKDPELIDQLDKHLKYMEKQIRQLQETSSKNLKKAKDYIHNRTEENKDLISILTELREKDIKRKEDQHKVDKKITQIQLAERRITTEIDKMKEEMQKMKLKDGMRPGLHKASEVYNSKKTGDDKVAEQFRRSQSKGRLIKGSLFNNRPSGMYKQQIQELLSQLDDANEQIVIQNLQITTLRDEFENARREILNNGQNVNAEQNQQYAQLSNEIQNLQMLTDNQQHQFIQQAMNHQVENQPIPMDAQEMPMMEHQQQLRGDIKVGPQQTQEPGMNQYEQ